MHGIREQEDEDDDENDIEGPCKRMTLHFLFFFGNLGGLKAFGVVYRE